MPRFQTRWFIEACQREAKMNPVLLELAKLDFNRVQLIYQRNSEKCRDGGATLAWQRLPFSRDRLFARFREAQTKAICMITTIDDVYDVYGTMDELELFTDAVDRWDVNAMDRFPEYMKICFLALFNTTNDTAYNVMKEKVPLSKQCNPWIQWADLCKAAMVEARWYHQGYTPNLEEYLENARVSISGPLILTLAYCTSDDITREALDGFQSCPEIARWSSMILRLCDDLGTSKDELRRGDVPKSIECHMHESGVSEDAAREHIRRLIRGNWKAINGDRSFTSGFEENLKMMAINIPRMAQCVYQYGDGYGKPIGIIEDRISPCHASTYANPVDTFALLVASLYIIHGHTNYPPTLIVIVSQEGELASLHSHEASLRNQKQIRQNSPTIDEKAQATSTF
ncbi:Myrcene synthase, chloroplastic [Musa troglodytarum]|uniref:Myrcene synthase, chloroplastic n=1 Tax=Musa troglodytarum TaxID=320322 RepID=A0A9E7FIW0_9LILI|nr:Myrcene synthase, chloroplastic [Musa troglodytarum]